MSIIKRKCSGCGIGTRNTYNNKPLCSMCKVSLEDRLGKAENVSDFKKRDAKILFYDIETTPLKAWVWRLGEQVVRHDHLDDDYNSYGIICIGYKWNDGKPARILQWGYNEQDTEKVVREFDELANKADVVIGKNSDRFDVKHINAQRLISGLPGLPTYLMNTDDLEKQIRKNFAFPSYSLDYLAKALLKNSGKDRMEFDDWINIVERKSRESYRKMLKYCKKDVEDTEKLWDFAKAHFKPRFNMATFNRGVSCSNCGSNNIKKNGTRNRGKTIFQMYYCNDHGGYAGDAPINLNKGTVGKIG